MKTQRSGKLWQSLYWRQYCHFHFKILPLFSPVGPYFMLQVLGLSVQRDFQDFSTGNNHLLSMSSLSVLYTLRIQNEDILIFIWMQCLVSRVQKRVWVWNPWNEVRKLWGAIGVLDIKPGPCGRAASTLEWTISSAPFIKKKKSMCVCVWECMCAHVHLKAVPMEVKREYQNL